MTVTTPCVRLTGWLRVVVVVGAALFLFSIVYGPYLSYTTQQNTNKTVNFIHQVQTSPAARTGRDAARWEVEELKAICDRLRCGGPPIPTDVARTLQAR